MRIRLSFVLEISRDRKAEPVAKVPPPGALNDNDQTLVEHAGPQRIGFTIPTSAPPHDGEPGEVKQ